MVPRNKNCNSMIRMLSNVDVTKSGVRNNATKQALYDRSICLEADTLKDVSFFNNSDDALPFVRHQFKDEASFLKTIIEGKV